MYKELLEYIVKNLVSMPDKISIEELNDDSKLTLKLSVAKEDMGRIIGKEGRIVRSIREIINAYATKNNEKVSVLVEEIKEQGEN
ncbi:MAG: KH domain-containing protein [Clostridia bacterium]|nr:KH domain-containing protein [Clostridia bacterium]